MWDWFHECRDRFAEEGDDERLRLIALHHQGFILQETDPERSLAVFTEARRLAEVLNEPWFVFFYDVWRLIAMTSYKHDYREALDLAVSCALEARKPPLAQHPWRYAAHNMLISTYLGIDPQGYAEELAQAFAYLDVELPTGPNPDRYVMLSDRREFAHKRGVLEEFHALCQQNLALGEVDDDDYQRDWHTVGAHEDLCWIHSQRQEWEMVLAHAEEVVAIANRLEQAECNLAQGLLWQAVYFRQRGEQDKAKRLFRRSIGRMAALQSQPADTCYDAHVLYHELGENWDKALEVRDRQLARIANRGALAYECEIQIQRCRLLKRMGLLSSADLQLARAAAERLRRPAWYLEQIVAVEGSKRGEVTG